jgi:DNA replication protein DnaC
LSEEELTYRLDGVWTAGYGRDTNEYVRAVAAARRLLLNGGWLTLAGPYGIGKTFMLCAIVNEGRLGNKTSLYIEWSTLLLCFRETFDEGSETRYATLSRQVQEAEILAVDELDPDRYKVTAWTEAELAILFNHRYRHKERLATVTATNNYDGLPDYLKSRMSEGRSDVVILTGDDVRPDIEGV